MCVLAYLVRMALPRASGGDGRIPRDTFKARIAIITAELGLNLRQFAELTGQKPENVRRWMRKNARPQNYEDLCKQIADATGYDRQWIASGGPLMEWSVEIAPDLGVVPDPTGPVQMALFEPDPLPGPLGLVNRLFGRRRTDINLA